MRRRSGQQHARIGLQDRLWFRVTGRVCAQAELAAARDALEAARGEAGAARAEAAAARGAAEAAAAAHAGELARLRAEARAPRPPPRPSSPHANFGPQLHARRGPAQSRPPRMRQDERGRAKLAALGVRQAEEDAAVALLEGSGAGAQAAARAAELERKLHGARQVASQAARRRELPAGACCVHVVPGPSHLPRPAQPSSLRPKLQTHTACSQPRPGTAASMPHSASARHQGGPARTVPDGSAAGCAYGI